MDSLVDPPIMSLQMVNLFLSKGANVSAKDKKERQAIHWAAYLGKWCHILSLFTQNENSLLCECKQMFVITHINIQ